MRAKSQGEHTADQRQQSPEEYAQGEVQQGVSGAVDRANGTAQRTARMSYRKFRALQEKRKTLAVQSSTATAPKPPEKEKVTVPTQAERRELFKKQRFRQKAVAAKKPAPQAPAPPADVPAPTPPPYRAQMQRLKRRHLTREVVRRYLQRQTATTAAASTAPLVTQAPKLPTISHKQATVDAISRGVHYIAAKIKALLSQTVRRAAQSLLALLGAGCVVLVLAMVIGAAAAVIGSPMGILFANESNDNDSIPIAEIVAETNADFGAAINDIVSAHPECSETTIAYSLSPELYAQFLCALFDAWYRDWKTGVYVSVRLFEDYIQLLMGAPTGTCSTTGACGSYMVVEGSGAVYPCDFYCLDEYKLGTIQNDSLQSLLLGEKMRIFIKDGRNVPAECQQCRWVNLCYGGCKRDRNTADKAQRSYYCKALQKFFAYAEPRMREMARAVQMYR